jgi:hypothetical protein
VRENQPKTVVGIAKRKAIGECQLQPIESKILGNFDWQNVGMLISIYAVKFFGS